MRKWIAAWVMVAAGIAPAQGQTNPPTPKGVLRAEGTRIVDGAGREVILRGMGLGGWMLQEGYMLQLPELKTQSAIRQRIASLIGEERTAEFYRAWLDHHVTKADIDAMAAAGFNSVRLPMHYNLLTLPIEREPVAGRDTWLEEGFGRIDELLRWTGANGMVLILDLHAAPGGQGTDDAIADRDPTKPSLWESAENRRKMVAIWRRLATRYAGNPWIGGYDILNEPNWDFEKPGGGHGCEETTNAPLKTLYQETIAAIRSVDRDHMIVIEGNCWGNNYRGLDGIEDPNLVLSFHKYWNRNDAGSIAPALKLRSDWGKPVWLGESGENSNRWFADAIRLVEGQRIGWNFWPWKKIGFNQPVEAVPNPGWTAVREWMVGRGPRPDPDAAYAALMRLATHDIAYANAAQHPDVLDAMLRQPHSDAALPFADHRLNRDIAAVDYDMGVAGVAYRDRDDANYHVATGGERTLWNDGRTYRNDGVDIARDAAGRPFVTAFGPGEWLRYTVDADAAGPARLQLVAGSDAGGAVEIAVNGAAPIRIAVPAGAGTRTLRLPVAAEILSGRNTIVVGAVEGENRLVSLRLDPGP